MYMCIELVTEITVRAFAEAGFSGQEPAKGVNPRSTLFTDTTQTHIYTYIHVNTHIYICTYVSYW